MPTGHRQLHGAARDRDARAGKYGLDEMAPYISYGASPAGRSASSSRPVRSHSSAAATTSSSRTSSRSRDALRHRLVLSYQALAEQVDADKILDAVIEKVIAPELDLSKRVTAA
jgi:MoxR-like ATPase